MAVKCVAGLRCMLMIFLQVELIVGDQSGAIHMWDLRTDHNEHLVWLFFRNLIVYRMIGKVVNLEGKIGRKTYQFASF